MSSRHEEGILFAEHGDDRSSSFCMSGNEEEAGVYVVLSDLAEGLMTSSSPRARSKSRRPGNLFQIQEKLLILPVFCLAHGCVHRIDFKVSDYLDVFFVDPNFEPSCTLPFRCG